VIFRVDLDPHLDGKSFRTKVLQPALDRAGVVGVTMHGLRHAHASWLLAGGVDLQVVKERLGHAKIATTEGYLHTLLSADESALAALGRIRGSGVADQDAGLIVAKREIEELKAALVT
jgi:site-specific recombinase XerD